MPPPNLSVVGGSRPPPPRILGASEPALGSDMLQRIMHRWERVRSERRDIEGYWEDLASVLYPQRRGFSTTDPRSIGPRRTERVLDSVPALAAAQLAASVDGLLTPKQVHWFWSEIEGDDLRDDDETRAWLERVDDLLRREIYFAPARFQQSAGEMYLDLVVFGTGPLWIGEDTRRAHLLFRSLHLRDTFLVDGADGGIDTVFLRRTMTARQALQVYRDEAGPIARELVDKGDYEKPVVYLMLVAPREDLGFPPWYGGEAPFGAVHIEVAAGSDGGGVGIRGGGASGVRREPFHELPVAAPRWDTMSGETYGWSPGRLALPDTKMAQEMARIILRAGHKAVDPPLLAPDEALTGVPSLVPGSVSYYDADMAMRMGGVRNMVVPLQSGQSLPVGLEMQQQIRDQIWGAFLRNVLNLPMDRPQMTATEVLERKEEFLRVVGPTFGRLETDSNAVIVARAFGLLLRRAAELDQRGSPLHPEQIPERLRGRSIRFAFASPVQRAQKIVEQAALARFIEMHAALLQLRPEMAQSFDVEAIARDAKDIGVPARYIHSPEKLAQIRRAEEERMQMAQGLEAMQASAKSAHDLAGAASRAPGVIDQLVGGMGGGASGPPMGPAAA